MFIRRCYRQKDGKRHAYWSVVESYRSERGPRQRVFKSFTVVLLDKVSPRANISSPVTTVETSRFKPSSVIFCGVGELPLGYAVCGMREVWLYHGVC
jgi:hypothetical protein